MPTFELDITPSHITDPQDQVTVNVDWDTIHDFLTAHSDLFAEWYLEARESALEAA